jgi:hypothetical protein
MTPEKRAAKRAASLNKQKELKEAKERNAKRWGVDSATIAKAETILKTHNPKKIDDRKKDGIYFYNKFNFLDIDIQKATKWVSPSFNYHRQLMDFFKKVCYSYHVPETIIYAALGTSIDNRITIRAEDTVRLWLYEIVTGESFAKLNKNIFTKKECHYLLSNQDSWKPDYDSLGIFVAKARLLARGINTRHIIEIIGHKFRFNDLLYSKTLISFLDFLERNKYNLWDKEDFIDICDFVESKITRIWSHGGAMPNNDDVFSFSNRTLQSVVDLSNKWHNDRMAPTVVTSSTPKSWAGYPISDKEYNVQEQDGNVMRWNVVQLVSQTDLKYEGTVMHHCVGSYIRNCADGKCTIFSIRRGAKSKGTFEVSKSHQIIQLKGPCNTKVSADTKKVFTKFCLDSRLHSEGY